MTLDLTRCDNMLHNDHNYSPLPLDYDHRETKYTYHTNTICNCKLKFFC